MQPGRVLTKVNKTGYTSNQCNVALSPETNMNNPHRQHAEIDDLGRCRRCETILDIAVAVVIGLAIGVGLSLI